MQRKAVLSIAGSDPSGGAGIQADLKTMLACGVYGMSAITALTAQNTQGVTDILPIPSSFLQAQLDAIFVDIPPQAVKIGMLGDPDLVKVIAERLTMYSAENIVVDPVAVATSGAVLSGEDTLTALKEILFPKAYLLTPNIPEGELLTGIKIHAQGDMEHCARTLAKTYQTNVLLKGGHGIHTATDLLCTKEGLLQYFYGERIDNPNTHGTGCTLSSAIASYLALGFSLAKAIEYAKDYLTQTLQSGLQLGKGSGPLDHGCILGK